MPTQGFHDLVRVYARERAEAQDPAFTVISFVTSLTKRSNSSEPGAASGPRMQ